MKGQTLIEKYLKLSPGRRAVLEAYAQIILAMQDVRKVGDYHSQRWIARRFQWLREEHKPFQTIQNLAEAWQTVLKLDPPPQSIAGIINKAIQEIEVR